MNRLITSGLMFGNLFAVDSPALVERYNRALKHLTGKQTQLSDFYIDISGFSPEIGHELNDPLYLNHAGVNRQFILLSTQQKTAPLLDAQFSTSRDILKAFITENEAALFSLTTRDAVAGELVNSVYTLSSPARLFDIRRIVVEADTTNGAIRQAARLNQKVDEFMTREDAWFDDVLIAEMIDIANDTGDVIRNPITLKHMEFEQRDFWTGHFGGLYLFQSLELPGVITCRPRAELGEFPVDYVFDLADRNRIASFLDLNGLVEPIVKARGIDAAAILRQKMIFILVDALAGDGIVFPLSDQAEMRRLAREHAGRLPPEFHSLNALVNWAENKGPWPRITSEDPAYFHTLRATAHPAADLVNMLLSDLCPADFRQMFICHKTKFYELYPGWSETKKEYVVAYLKEVYQGDKPGVRRALFGHEAPRDVPSLPEIPPRAGARDTAARIGPWGPVKRR